MSSTPIGDQFRTSTTTERNRRAHMWWTQAEKTNPISKQGMTQKMHHPDRNTAIKTAKTAPFHSIPTQIPLIPPKTTRLIVSRNLFMKTNLKKQTNGPAVILNHVLDSDRGSIQDLSNHRKEPTRTRTSEAQFKKRTQCQNGRSCQTLTTGDQRLPTISYRPSTPPGLVNHVHHVRGSDHAKDTQCQLRQACHGRQTLPSAETPARPIAQNKPNLAEASANTSICAPKSCSLCPRGSGARRRTQSTPFDSKLRVVPSEHSESRGLCFDYGQTCKTNPISQIYPCRTAAVYASLSLSIRTI